MNILSMFDRNWHLKYLSPKDHLRCILKRLTTLFSALLSLKAAFFSLKGGKSPRSDEINYDIVK